jgi:tape measure domain-containing protein
MAETHELRLKIDASAAKRGGREFTSAVDAVKRAVRDLERDSTGAFTKLRKNLDSLAKNGKVDVGISKADVTTLNAFAKAQTQIVSSTTSSNKGIKTLVSTMRGLSDSYGMARKTSEAFSVSILKTNSALSRQIQLASQARSAVRQVRTAPIAASAPSGDAATASSVRAITAAFDGMNKASRSAGATASNALGTLGKQARLVMRSQTDATNATVKNENVQLSSAAAMRRAENEAVRLAASLRAMGDTRGANQVSQALIKLKANMSGGVESALKLRTAMDQFSQTTGRAKISIAQVNAAKAAATAENKRLASAERDTANAARRVEAEMRSVAGATNATSQALSRATGNMRGLENAFSGTFQVGSAFRTMLGSITLGTFTKGMFEAGNALDQFRVTMEVATGSTQGAAREMDYIDDVANRLGTNLQSARDNYSKFAISADIAGVSTDKTRKIFESVSTAMAVLGKGTEDQNLAFMALEQMMSKGTVSSEELRRQLGERLPGAVNIMAKALNVTTGELQDLLKAGAISSADALPKFADELQKRFGPGLQKATQRAGYSLGTLSNEITKFQETVAQSGFMQVLAQQFARLTQVMRGPEARDAAVKLGEGFAYMAEKGGNAIVYLIENIDKIGTAIKAIAGGVIAKQILLMGNAFAVSGQQLAALFTRFGSGSAVLAAQQASTQRYTSTLGVNTAALAGNSAALAARTAAGGRLAVAESAWGASMGRNATTMAKSSSSLVGIGKIAARAAGGFGFMSAALGTLAGPIGIAITGLMLFPGALDKVRGLFGMVSQDAASDMSAVDAAVRRSGAKFEELGVTMQETATNGAIRQIIDDLVTLEGSIPNKIGANRGQFDSLKTASSIATGAKAPGVFDISGGRDENNALRAVGATRAELENLSTGAKAATQDIVEMFAQFERGGASAPTSLDMFNQIERAKSNFPEGEALFGSWSSAFGDFVTMQLAAQAQTDKLVALTGTATDQSLMALKDMRQEVYRGEKSLGDLKDAMEGMAEANPDAAGKFKDMFSLIERSFAENMSSADFNAAASPLYDSIAMAGPKAQQAAAALRAAYSEAVGATASSFDELVYKIDVVNSRAAQAGSGITAVDPAVLASVETALISFEELSNTKFDLSSYDAIIEKMGTLSPAATQMTTTVKSQFEKLGVAGQTLGNFEGILLSTAAAMPEVTEEVEDLIKGLMSQAQAGNEAYVSVDDLANVFARLPSDVAVATKAALDNATAVRQAGAAAEQGGLDAAYGADEAGAAAASAAAKVRSLNAALNTLRGAGAGLLAKAGEMAADIRFEADLQSLPVFEREAAKFQREAMQELGANRTQMMKEYAEAGIDTSIASKMVEDSYNEQLTLVMQGEKALADAGLYAYNAAEWEDPKRKSGSKKKAAKPKLSDDAKSADKIKALYDQRELQRSLNEDLAKQVVSLEEQANAHMLLANGIARSSEEAEYMAQAMRAGVSLDNEKLTGILDQVHAYNKLNEAMERLANDPVKAWMDSVPDWIEAAQTIEMEAIGGLSSALSEFIQTGKLNFADLASSIAGSMADILADQAISGIMNKMGRKEGNGLAGLGGGGDQQQQIAAGGQQAASLIGAAINNAGAQTASRIAAAMGTAGSQVQAQQIQAGAMNATQIQAAEISGGAQHSAQVQQAIVAGGAQHAAQVSMAASTGGITGGLASMGLNPLSLGMMAVGFMSEGGYSNKRAPQTGKVSAATFHNAPQFAEGTANTSGGIPAILHDNEAVVPLSKGRKIPVDLGDGAGGGANVASFNMGDIVVNVEAGDGDGMNPDQAKFLGAEITKTVEAVVQTQLAKNMRYGGMLKPRGM